MLEDIFLNKSTRSMVAINRREVTKTIRPTFFTLRQILYYILSLIPYGLHSRHKHFYSKITNFYKTTVLIINYNYKN